MIESIGISKPDNYTFVGMSNSGKSYWSANLETCGYHRICCDDEIETRLGPILSGLGYRGIADVAKWMGLPYEPQSPANQRRYLELETQIMWEIVRKLQDGATGLVIDTTGSVIYTGERIAQGLRKYSRVIYLETPKSVMEEMFARFIAEPKPVIWGDIFKRRSRETNKAALGRCYANLLIARARAYSKIAHVRLPYESHHRKGMTARDFVSAL